MHAIIPLLFIFILLNSYQLKHDKLYRANVFALVGISYFSLLQYTLYWYRIFPSASVAQYIPALLTVLATVGVALSPWNKKSHPIKTTVLCGVFAASLVSTFAFDTEIKEKLAEIGGFFSQSSLFKSTAIKPTLSETLTLPELGFQLNPPSSWQQQHLASGHRYFIQTENEKKILEARPNCLGDFDMDTPTYLLNALELFEAHGSNTTHSYICVKKNGSKECLIEVKYPNSSGLLERWHWLKIPPNRYQSIALDFLIYREDGSFRMEIPAVTESVKPLGERAAGLCHTPAAWM